MNTIEQAKKDKLDIASKIGLLLKEFEDKYGENCIHDDLRINRHNGSTDCSGKIVGIRISLTF